MDQLELLEALGLVLPSRAYLVGAVLFGIVGYLGYRHGKRSARPRTKWIGVGLMLYPSVIGETWLLYAVGAGLCAWLYVSTHDDPVPK